MKKSFILFFVLITSVFYGQDFKLLDNYKFDKAESYNIAEPHVIESSNYLFTTPVEENNLNRLVAIQFILKWMEGTNYTFNLDSKVMDLVGENQNLLGLYMAGMSKVVLENKSSKLTDDEVYDKVLVMLVDYCKNKENNLKPTKNLKKAMK
ncbi:MAG: hypothetical protein ABNG98_03850 [Flavobacterium sp.]|jgi:hypothetical protein